MSDNPYGVKPGQVWADTFSGRNAVVVSVRDDHAYMLGVATTVNTSRKLASFSPHCNFILVEEGQPLPMKTPQAAKTAPYLTVIPDRNPKNKPHLSLGEAKKAVLFRLRGERLAVTCSVYQWNDEMAWVPLWKIDAGTLREDMPWN